MVVVYPNQKIVTVHKAPANKENIYGALCLSRRNLPCLLPSVFAFARRFRRSFGKGVIFGILSLTSFVAFVGVRHALSDDTHKETAFSW